MSYEMSCVLTITKSFQFHYVRIIAPNSLKPSVIIAIAVCNFNPFNRGELWGKLFNNCYSILQTKFKVWEDLLLDLILNLFEICLRIRHITCLLHKLYKLHFYWAEFTISFKSIN